MSNTQEHELGREIPRFEPWLGWALFAFVPAAGLVVTPSTYDRPLIAATIGLLAVAAVSLVRQTARLSRGGGHGEGR
jgi:hypothetical protein